MGPSEKSFNQVKSILNKLDRSIDEARAKRTHVKPVPPPPPPAPTPIPTPSRTESLSSQPPARPSPGRATPLPLRPAGGQPFANPPQAQRRVP